MTQFTKSVTKELIQQPESNQEILERFKLSNNDFNDSKYSKDSNLRTTRAGGITTSGLDEYNETTRRILEKAKIPQIGESTLTGRYPENKVYFPLYDVTKITPRPDLDINFILKINSYVKSGSGVGNRYKLFTSSKIYEILVDANNRNIPYPSLAKLVDIVEIDLKSLIDRVKLLRKDETSVSVTINNNLGIKYVQARNDYEIDYDIFLKYINWCVTKPGIDYDERLIPVLDISDVVISEDLEAEGEPEDDTTPTTNNNNQQPTYEPVGRPGITIGETTTINGVEFEWNGTSWEPSELGNPSSGNQGGTPSGGGSGNQGGGGTNQEFLGGFS
jgi:hypothetical protein